jgi:hypothetical protein
MVSLQDARQVFGRAFSRPPRMLFGNPVCFIFSAYYAYLYGELRDVLFQPDLTEAIIYVFLVSVPLAFGSPPFDREGLFSYHWPQASLSLSYIGLGAFQTVPHSHQQLSALLPPRQWPQTCRIASTSTCRNAPGTRVSQSSG